MIDREKIIKGLECCSQMAGEVCRECPYANECEEGDGLLAISAHLAADALSFLKAQEPVEPKMMEFVDEGMTWEKYEVPTCGVCGALLGDALFCPMCGRAVKWEIEPKEG